MVFPSEVLNPAVYSFGLWGAVGVRGMAAAEAVKAGDTLVSLPRSAALLAAPGQKPFPEWVDPVFWDGKPWYDRFVYMLPIARRNSSMGAMFDVSCFRDDADLSDRLTL